MIYRPCSLSSRVGQLNNRIRMEREMQFEIGRFKLVVSVADLSQQKLLVSISTKHEDKMWTLEVSANILMDVPININLKAVEVMRDA